MTDSLTEARQFLSAYEEAGPDGAFPPVAERWRDRHVPRLAEMIRTSSDAIEAIARANRYHCFVVNIGGDTGARAIRWQAERLADGGVALATLPPSWQESLLLPPEFLIESDGRRLSADFFRLLHIILRISKNLPELSPNLRICELGAGCGHLARMLRLVYPQARILIVDLPQSLAFSYIFLRESFPDLLFRIASRRRDVDEAGFWDADFAFLPTSFADEIAGRDVDLFINTASLGEMPNSAIRYWMDLFQNRTNTRFVYWLNRFLNWIDNTSNVDWRSDCTEAAVSFDPAWALRCWELEPPVFDCPYVYGHHPRYLEIVAERPDGTSLAERQESRRRFAAECLKQDWALQPPENAWIRQYRGRPMRLDLGLGGTLCKLWDAVRINSGPEAARAMCAYLEYLQRGTTMHFEEYPWYKAHLEALSARQA